MWSRAANAISVLLSPRPPPGPRRRSRDATRSTQTRTMLFRTVFTLLLVLFATSMASALPRAGAPAVRARQDGAQPDFPADPPSCPLCAQGFPGIDSCAQAAPVFANLSMILFNPGAFIDVIRCACTDTFQSTYPQCVDCFTKTNQTQYLNTTDAPDVIQGIRNGCALLSTFVGNAPSADGEIPSSTSSVVPTPTASTNGVSALHVPLAMSCVSLVIALAGLF